MELTIFIPSVFLFIGNVASQDYHDLRIMEQLRDLDKTPLREIPKKFTVGPESSRSHLLKYMNQIHALADKENVSVVYKVKVEVVKSLKKPGRKVTQNKYKSKKYNVPLKKKNGKLSHFEIIMRKLADTQKERVVKTETTEAQGVQEHYTTTKVPILKYKPIINRNKPYYAKTPSKPIRNKEITLTK